MVRVHHGSPLRFLFLLNDISSLRMFYFWKTKDIKFLYKIKIILRDFKYFLIQLIKLIKIRTNFSIILQFIINYFRFFEKNSEFIKDIYIDSKFDFPDWFSIKIPILIHHLNKNKFSNTKIEILEIGSFEGRSSLFFINYFKKKLSIKNVKITCVDTWEGSNEDMHKNISFDQVEKNFDQNLKIFDSIVDKKKNTSHFFFKEQNSKSYDLILIDGSHKFEDVLLDAKNSINNINENGIIIFDDFNWFHYKNEKENPAHAINLIIKENLHKFKIVFVGMILIMKKI